MPIWIVPIVVIIALAVLGLLRLRIPHDSRKEVADDSASVPAYDRVSHWLLFSFIRYLIIRQVKRYTPHGILVDAGCGPGYLDMAIARQFPRLEIAGIDISREMLDLALKNRSSANLDQRVQFRQDDVQSLSLEGNSVDFVISSLSLHHWSAPPEALAEIYRVLKPRGQLLIFDLRRDEPLLVYYVGAAVQSLFAPPAIRRINGGIGSIWASYTPSEMRTLLTASPFHHWTVKAGWGWAYLWGQK